MESAESLAVAFFAEVLMVDQLARASLDRVLPKGMELSHFTVLNHLAHVGDERTPAELARALHLTRGAITNTLGKLEWAGWIHIRPDWDDARRKLVASSPAGLAARDAAVAAMAPALGRIARDIGAERVRGALPVLRELRQRLSEAAGGAGGP